VRAYIHFLSYPAHFLLEWEIFRTSVIEKIKTHVFYSVTFFENRVVYEKMWKNIVIAGQATDDNRAHAHFMLGTYGYKQTHSGCVIHIVCHSNNGCTNATQCYVKHTLPVLFIVRPGGT
jgi:hypothetical protein